MKAISIHQPWASLWLPPSALTEADVRRIISSESQIARIKDLSDRREIRNFQRFLKLWPLHGYDMLSRPRWQKYLAVSPAEAVALQTHPPFVARGES